MKKILMLFLFTGFLWSCSSDDDNGGAPDETSILPVKVTYTEGEDTYDVLFAYNGKKVSTMTYSANSPLGNAQVVFEYDGDKIIEASLALEVGYITKTYTYENNRIASMKEVFGRDGVKNSTYNWIDDNHVKLTDEGTGYTTDFYFNNGNIVKVEDYFGGSVWKSNFTFDNKNRPFINVEGFQYLIEEEDLHFFNRNNVLKDVTTAGDSTFVTDYSYEYNGDNFPTKQTSISDVENITYTFTYNQ